MADELLVADADPARDGHDLLSFCCWSGDPHEVWIHEVEEYVRRIALRTTFRTLVFRSRGGELAGVSAFDRADVRLAGRRRTAAWRLEVVALALPWQGRWVNADIEGCPSPMKAAEFVLRKTYERMLQIDARRVAVVARVHDDNRASMKTCERVGLVRTERESNEYWAMLGEVNPAAQPIT